MLCSVVRRGARAGDCSNLSAQKYTDLHLPDNPKVKFSKSTFKSLLINDLRNLFRNEPTPSCGRFGIKFPASTSKFCVFRLPVTLRVLCYPVFCKFVYCPIILESRLSGWALPAWLQPVNWRHFLAIFLGAAALWIPVCGQEISAGAGDRNPTPPAFGVLDRTGYFHRKSGSQERISARIRALQQKHDFMLYVVVEPVLLGSSAIEHASELQHEWLPNGGGLVVVLESDSRKIGTGRDVAAMQATAETPTRVPTFEMDAIVKNALDSTDATAPPDAYLEALVANLADGFDGYFQRREEPPPASRSLKLGLLLAGTLAVLGLGAIGIGGLMRHPAVAGPATSHFPPVDGRERLGAPCGAQVTTRSFGRPDDVG